MRGSGQNEHHPESAKEYGHINNHNSNYDVPVDTPTRREKRDSKRKSSRRRKSYLGIAVMSLLVMCALAVVGAGYFFLLSENVVAPGDEVAVEIAQGTSVVGIAEQLEAAGLVDNALIFRIRVRLAEADGLLLAGDYRLRPGMTYDELIATLVQGPPPLNATTITIPEGRSIDRMADILAESMEFSADEFMEVAQFGAPEFAGEFPFLIGAFDDSLEGYLFPDTYEFLDDASPHDVITVMLQRFEEVWDELGDPTGPAVSMSASELVVIASLVEMESSLANERPLVSSVIYNRLDINRKLQFCSTVQFLMPGDDRQRLRLTYAETLVPSPYNTYLNEGLPPGPISNPGRQALDAALHPADTDYIYFVLTGTDGSQTFASNNADFERARQLSREVFGE